MPQYDYHCKQCDRSYKLHKSISEYPGNHIDCLCGGKATQYFTETPMFHLKGDGFHKEGWFK